MKPKSKVYEVSEVSGHVAGAPCPPSADRLRDLFNYDSEAGLLKWAVRRGRIPAGSTAGCLDRDGYVVVRIDKRAYFAHRIIYCMAYGLWPQGQIDHINGSPSDNRLKNLRDVAASVNNQNFHRANINNKSTGVLGVSRSGGSKANPYRACIHLDGRFIHIGNFPDTESARNAYLHAKRALHLGCTI